MSDPLSRLEHFTRLYQEGKLTEAEYQMIKASLLQQLSQSTGESTASAGPEPVGELLGVGRLGHVFEQLDPEGLGENDRAIKLIREEWRKEAYLERLKYVFDKVSVLNHPNIVRYLELQLNPQPLVFMELLKGAPFSVNDEPVPAKAVEFIIEKILEGLSYLHQNGILHGDIKPSNLVLCQDGQVKILDPQFWIVLNGLDEEASQRLQQMQWSGELRHMAPESFDGVRGFAADVYSVGLIAWELLTGQKACPYDFPEQQKNWHINEDLTDPRTYNPDVPEWMVGAIRRMTLKDSFSRTQSGTSALQMWSKAALAVSYPQVDVQDHDPSLVGPNINRSLNTPAEPNIHTEDNVSERSNSYQSASDPQEPQSYSGNSTQSSDQPAYRAPEGVYTNKNEHAARENVSRENTSRGSLSQAPKRDTGSQQANTFSKLVALMSISLKKYLRSKLKLKSLNTEASVVSESGFLADLNNRPAFKLQQVYLPLYQKQQTLNYNELIGVVLIPLDFLARVFSWSTGLEDEGDEPELSWVMRHFAEQLLGNVFVEIAEYLPFNVFVGEPDLDMPQFDQELCLAEIRVVRHSKLGVAIDASLFKAQNKSFVSFQDPQLMDVFEPIDDVELELRVETGKIRIPFHKLKGVSVGTIFPLPKNWLNKVHLKINGQNKFVGEYGEQEGYRAIRIKKRSGLDIVGLLRHASKK